MKLSDLFVNYKQVEPIEFTPEKINLPTHIYINADRAKRATSEQENPTDVDVVTDQEEGDFVDDMTTWKVKSTDFKDHSDYKTRLRNFIIGFEGFRSEAYLDGKHYAVGYGFNDPKYKKGDTMTREEADAELDRQLTTRENKYLKRFGDKWSNLTDNQRIALMSYGYNTGDNNIINGSVAKYLDSGDMESLRNAIRINTVGGVYNAGLEARRKKERDLFNS